MIPKNKEALEKEYKRCQRSFITVGREAYRDYFEEAYSDLDSAEKEENDKWAIAKAYQALFLYCNGLLVKKIGFYSKDHGCVLVGLLKNNIVSKEILERLSFHQSMTGGETNLEKRRGDRASASERACRWSLTSGVSEPFDKIHKMLDEKKKVFTEIELRDNFFEEIGRIRVARNRYLYLPKTQRKLKDSPKERIKEVKEIIRILGEIE